jgi:thiamine monophosphate synthase
VKKLKFLCVGDEMEMFLVAVGLYGIGVLTMLLPHGMQRAAHWLANSAALFGSAVCAYAAGLLLFGGVSPANIREFFDAGCISVGLASSLMPKDAVAANDWEACAAYVRGMVDQIQR